MAKALGCKTVFIAYVAPKDRPTTAKGWRQLACQVQHYAQPVLNAGIQVGWHNHDFEIYRSGRIVSIGGNCYRIPTHKIRN